VYIEVSQSIGAIDLAIFTFTAQIIADILLVKADTTSKNFTATKGRKIGFSVQRSPNPASIRGALLKWYRVNARTHPWRGTGDPYAVWLSEIMLQQTQIATATPYYERFIAAFPTVSALAAAPLERVLELWSGLGYYRRARHLHQAAQTVARFPGAKFPDDYEGLRALPGIGDYTARAILSIAFGQPYAVLDGNVARVVARLHRLRGNIHQPEFRRVVERELALLLSKREPGDFNQAMMELGQTVCLPKNPQCPACPVGRWCLGYGSGTPEEFPIPRPRRAAELHHLAAALIRHKNKIAMVQGLEKGLMDDLWNFPAAFGESPTNALRSLQQKLQLLTTSKLTWSNTTIDFRHAITYRTIRGLAYLVRAPRVIRHPHLRWFELKDLPQAAISQLARKIIGKIPSL
jgi:A/G-specific adenine glycosylase